MLVRNFPAEVLVLSALLELLFEEEGAARNSDKSAGSRQKNIAGSIFNHAATTEKG